MILKPDYVLDANVFIEAAKGYYAFDIAPRFWDALVQSARNGIVVSVDRVKVEIDEGDDDLKEWADREFASWFAPTDTEAIVDSYGRVMAWAYAQSQYTDAAKTEFAREKNADAWVISKALSDGIVVVTHERFNPNRRRKIPIPNACRAFGVGYVDTFGFLRNLGIQLG